MYAPVALALILSGCAATSGHSAGSLESATTALAEATAAMKESQNALLTSLEKLSENTRSIQSLASHIRAEGARISGAMAGGGGKGAGAAFQDAAQAVIAKLEPSVVYVELSLEDSRRGAQSGTGLVLSKDGIVLVAGRVEREKLRRIEIWIGDTKYKGRFLRSDDTLQMSVVRIDDPPELAPVALKELPDPKAGEWVVSLTAQGKQHNFQKYPDFGVAIGTVFGQYDRLLVSGLTSGGRASGMPVVNLSGELIGIVKDGGVVVMRDLKADIDKLVAKATGKSETPDGIDPEKDKPWLGVSLAPIVEAYAEEMELPKSGIWVQYAAEGSPAWKGGLREGDLIIELNGNKIAFTGGQAMQYFYKLLKPDIGRLVTFKVLRNGKEMEFDSTFVKRPEPKEYAHEGVGIQVTDVTGELAFNLGLAVDKGVLVQGVTPGSPAARGSGFRDSLVTRSDVIVEFDGHAVASIEDLTKAIDAMKARDATMVLVKLYRGRATVYAALNLKIGS